MAGDKFEDSEYLGSAENPFNLFKYKISQKAFVTVCKLLSPEHYKVQKLTIEEVKECDRVVEVLGIDHNRATYFYRSRQGDQTHGTYKMNIQQDTKVSLDDENQSRQRDFRTRVVIVKDRFRGATSKGFEFKIPDDVLAIKRFRIQYDYLGGSVQMNHLSPIHQSCIEISNEHVNNWFTDIQV